MTAADEIVEKDVKGIIAAVGDKAAAFAGQRILITGGAGFLGYYLTKTLLAANEMLEKPCTVIILDNFSRGMLPWLEEVTDREDVHVVKGDVASFDYGSIAPLHYIIHAASIASPAFYRKYPIETMDANVQGLRRLLEYAKQHPVRSFLFFSSSEIYGDPPPEMIPTPETYRGNVSCTGPRACYDESKRYGETLCVNFHRVHRIPAKIVRPFNNYGPGLRLDDGRVIPDFCRNVLEGKSIVMHSDGSPTRTFCYVADAVTGYLLALLSPHNGEAFNIGTEEPEISVKELAEMIVRIGEEVTGSSGLKVVTKASEDKQYLSDNPQKRQPSIAKARKLLGYEPKVGLDEGLRRTLQWYAGEAK